MCEIFIFWEVRETSKLSVIFARLYSSNSHCTIFSIQIHAVTTQKRKIGPNGPRHTGNGGDHNVNWIFQHPVKFEENRSSQCRLLGRLLSRCSSS